MVCTHYHCICIKMQERWKENFRNSVEPNEQTIKIHPTILIFFRSLLLLTNQTCGVIGLFFFPLCVRYFSAFPSLLLWTNIHRFACLRLLTFYVEKCFSRMHVYVACFHYLRSCMGEWIFCIFAVLRCVLKFALRFIRLHWIPKRIVHLCHYQHHRRWCLCIFVLWLFPPFRFNVNWRKNNENLCQPKLYKQIIVKISALVHKMNDKKLIHRNFTIWMA